jgi:hypothetical protein
MPSSGDWWHGHSCSGQPVFVAASALIAPGGSVAPKRRWGVVRYLHIPRISRGRHRSLPFDGV